MSNKRRSFYFPATVLLLVIAAGVYFFSETQATFRAKDRDFSVSRDMDIVRIYMSSADAENILDLTFDEETDEWRLNDTLFANDSAIRELIEVLSRLRVQQPVSVVNREKVEKMLQSYGVRVDVYVQAYRIRIGDFEMLPYHDLYQSFLVGKDAPDGQSTYMRKIKSEQAFRVTHSGFEEGVSFLFDPGAKGWLDPVIFNTAWEALDQVTVIVPEEPGESFVLKTTGETGFAFYQPDNPDQPLQLSFDTLQVARFLSSFEDIYYESLLDEQGEKTRQELMVEKPFMEITVQPKNGAIRKIRAFARLNPGGNALSAEGTPLDPNRFYIELGPGEYALAQYYVFNRILRPLSFFISKN